MKRITLLMVVLLVSAAAVRHGESAAQPRVIHIVAERFLFTPSEITVEEGSLIELRITSEDTDHGFRLRGLGDVNLVIPKRGRGDVRVTIEARELGNYVFECSHVCGAGHGFMRGTLRVKARPSSSGPR